ncbi:hypothetical protein U91I_03282 [alpha proteobacterium U9-1i]|nr:hypothetical protein U91I_03282 [alpha proteobacterium U9-1i]
MKRFAAAIFAALLTACANAPGGEFAAICAPPTLVASELRVGDGAADRGFLGGVSLIDADGDGDLDLMTTAGYSPSVRPFVYRANILYLNDGAGNFARSTDAAFSPADNPYSGSSWGDVDHDGDLDAFIGVQHGRPDVFIRNLGGGRFAREELGDATTTPGSNFAVSWVDIDRDGDLDLMSGGPTLELNAPLLVYRNDDGVFSRVTGTAIENGAANPGAILWADYDNDGDVDLFVPNSDILRRSNMAPGDYEAPQLYRNDGEWRFVRTEGQGFSDIAYASASAATDDIDGDGDLDLFTGNFAGGDFIFLNDGEGLFTRDTRFSAPTHEQWATGAAFADLDLDGDLDLLHSGYESGISAWRNDGSGAFAPFAAELGERVSTHSGMATGDLDGDGDLDVVIGNWGETTEGDYITVLRNESGLCGTPLRVTLRDRYGAPDPIGARATLVTRGPAGERRQIREAMGQSAMRSQSGSTFYYGVPRGERVLRLEVRWPDGRVQNVTRFNRDGLTTIRPPAE